MTEKIEALLVQANPGPPEALRQGLEEQAIEIHTARNCFEAALVLCSSFPPHLVLTDLELPDGDWSDVLRFAASACAPVNVVVVSPQVDIGLYIEAMELGAFDFMVSPPSLQELSHILRVATANVCARRLKSRPVPRAGSCVIRPLADSV